MLNVIDLFCGAGGFSQGFKEAGFNVLMGVDFNKYAIQTHLHNFPETISVQANLTEITPKELLDKYNIDKNIINGIVGGPPCQGFSVAGKRLVDDPRNKLFLEFVKFVEYIRPQFFLMENVPGLLSMSNGKVKEEIINIFSSLGYNVDAKILIAADYGVPQLRKRLFFMGVMNKTPVFPKPYGIEYLAVGKAINDLPKLELGEGSQEIILNNGQVVYNHYAFPLTEINKERIKNIPIGGTYSDLPEYLKRAKDFNSAYRRLNENKPSFTINTHFRDEFVIHPTQNRLITVREAARLQSFPDEFKFIGPNSREGQFGLVGNAVPPLLAKAWANTILKLLT